MLWTILLILLLVILIATLPTWPYSRGWTYYPSGVVAALLVALILLVYFGLIALWYPWSVAV